jgi:hypothetical protein
MLIATSNDGKAFLAITICCSKISTQVVLITEFGRVV